MGDNHLGKSKQRMLHGSGWNAMSLAAFGCAMLGSLPLVTPAHAEAEQSAQDRPSDTSGSDDNQIIVIGNRLIVSALANVEVEDTLDQERVDGYGASTVGDLLERIKEDKGDSQPALLINGQPVGDLSDIADLPVEALARIEVLPRGAASRIGGGAGQRAYNVVLKKSFASRTLTVSRQASTEGSWGQNRGEGILTWIRGKDRLNFSVRASTSDKLFEADRGITPTAQSVPYASPGNVIPRIGTEIDPALSALAGHPVSKLALPASGTVPSLASLLSGIDRSNDSGLGLARTLRGATRQIEESLTGNKVIAPWLEVSLNARLGQTRSEGSSGLPAARFLVPATNRSTPFSTAVVIALNDPARPLVWSSIANSGSIATTFNATLGQWQATLLTRWELRERLYTSQLTSAIPGGLITLDDGVNPFSASLAGLIPVSERSTTSRSETSQVALDVEGPIFRAPAGPVRLRLGGGATWSKLDSTDPTFGAIRFRRHELTARAGVTIPLAGDPDFLPALGKAELLLDAGRVDLGTWGNFNRYAVGLNWSPLPWLRLALSQAEDGRATAPEMLAAPQNVLQNVPYFDPLTNQTSTVTLITGGSSGLMNEKQRSRSLSLTASPPGRNNLLLSVDYTVSDLLNQIGAVPPPSAAVLLAFPERFQRDASGRLLVVDASPVNFAQSHARQLRLAANVTLPLSPPTPARSGEARKPRLQLQATFAQTLVLESTATIRAGLPQVDLLDGGAIGIGGGQQRAMSDASLSLTKGGNGLRLSASRRGESLMRTGTATAPDMLTFAPIIRLDARGFVDLGSLFAHNSLTKGARITIAAENLTNSRQHVANMTGQTPSGFQGAYRDPLGRTISIELRKSF